jgi:hypothetical protein
MTDPEVYVYTGEGGAEVPQDVVCVRVDPSVTSIPACAFDRRKKLAEVELSDVKNPSLGATENKHPRLTQED